MEARCNDGFIQSLLSAGAIRVDVETGAIFRVSKDGEERPISWFVSKKGYKILSFFEGGRKIRKCSAHRIVWVAAHGPVPAGYVVDHINNVKTDNRIANLQLLTPAENTKKAAKDGVLSKKTTAEMRSKIICLAATTRITQYELARIFGLSQPYISKIVNAA